MDITQALDRVLAKDVISPVSVPPHDNSAMDGYAFDGQRPAVRRPFEPHRGGHGARRQGLDASPAARRVREDHDRRHHAARPGHGGAAGAHRANRRHREPVAEPPSSRAPTGAGSAKTSWPAQPALLAGQRLTPAALGLLASLGLQTLPVVRRLRVAYFSTGDEILSPGEAPREGAVYDSNRFTLTSLLSRMGIEVIDMGVVPDQPGALRAAFERAGREADAVLTSGGVSMGDADHTRAIIQQLGQVDFWRIAMRPGRPMAFGRLDAVAGATPKGAGCLACPATRWRPWSPSWCWCARPCNA